MKNKKIIDKNQLLSNLRQFQTCDVCAMVKSNAYGHGTKNIVEIIENQVAYFGVAAAGEGAELRKLTQKPILICAKTKDFQVAKRNELEIIVETKDDIVAAVESGLKDYLHLKIDCGMNRYGVKDEQEIEKINDVLRRENIKLKTICTHFPCTGDVQKTLKNYENFFNFRKKIDQNCKICFGGSEIAKFPFRCDMVRVGIGLYGYGAEGVKPVMKITSYVNKIVFVKKGEFVGYGTRFKVKKDGFFAVVPVGYGDGLRRGLSGKFFVKIREKLLPAFGNICMDCFFVRVDGEICEGDEVEVMWDAEKLAEKIGTISYEILTGFSNFRGEDVIV